MEISPINSKRIYQSVVEQFVGLLKSGKMKPGDKLPPERTLAELFRVSRASIREAFSAMEIIGLIEVRPGDGSFVTDLNIAPFLNTIAPLFIKNETMETELLEFRKLLEREAVELAAMKADAAGLKLLGET
ncbi:MAG: GntR family transcriptional regulator, partial [Bacillota bacterium]